MSEEPDPVESRQPTPSESADAPEEPRRYPSTIGGVVFLMVLGATVVGLGIVALGSWRQGIGLVGATLILAALARLGFRTPDAGMLKVRSKLFDAALLSGLGALLIFLALTIPDQPV